MSDERNTGQDQQEPNPIEVWLRFWRVIKKPKNSSAVNAVATMVLCVITFLYAVTSYLQWQATSEAARAAQDAANIASETLQIDQRAWVTVSDIARDKSGTGFSVIFSNSGKTPARRFTVQIIGEPVPRGKSPGGKEDLLPGLGLIAPNGFFHISLTPTGPYDSKANQLAVHGKVDYIDIFDESHWTTFCYYVAAERNQELEFAPCEGGNDTDDKPITRPTKP